MYLRSLVLFLSGSISQALNHAQSALRYDQEHSGARKLLKRIRTVERSKEEGNNAFKSGRIGEAIEKYSECLEAIGQNEEEGNGGGIRATLLSNRATALLKVSISLHTSLSLIDFSSVKPLKHFPTPNHPSFSPPTHSKPTERQLARISI